MSSPWQALADPNRRAVLALLLERPRPVGELVERLGLSQPGTSKHLRVLREAGLVQVRREANRRVYALDPGPLNELDVWLAPYRRLWNDSLDACLDKLGGDESDWEPLYEEYRRRGLPSGAEIPSSR